MKKTIDQIMRKGGRSALLAAVAIVAATVLGGTAYAASTFVVYGGNLSISGPTVGNFGTVALDGSAKTATADMGTFTVADARGTGAGWHVTVQADPFATTGHTLQNASISMPAPSVAKLDSTSGPVPSIVAGPYSIDVPSAVKVASAAADGTGMGSYTFTPGKLTLHIPADAYAGTYTSTVTVSVVSGP